MRKEKGKMRKEKGKMRNEKGEIDSLPALPYSLYYYGFCK